MYGGGYAAKKMMANAKLSVYDSFDSDHYIGSQLKFAWLPENCHITGKLLWLEYAYKLTSMWNGPGEPVFVHRWHDKNSHIIWMLKKDY